MLETTILSFPKKNTKQKKHIKIIIQFLMGYTVFVGIIFYTYVYL